MSEHKNCISKEQLNEIMKDFPMNLRYKHKSDTLELATVLELEQYHNQAEKVRNKLLLLLGIDYGKSVEDSLPTPEEEKEQNKDPWEET